MNLYGYGDGDPINNSDPFGLTPGPVIGFTPQAVAQAAANAQAEQAAESAEVLGMYAEAFAKQFDIVTGAFAVASIAGSSGRGGAAVGRASAGRVAQGLQDQMTMAAARKGAGKMIISNLSDPKFKGMQKWSYTVKSKAGAVSEVHYVKDPKTGATMDFKFKQSAVTHPQN